MSGPGSLSAAGLMALERQALVPGLGLAMLAERPGVQATRARGQGHEIREIRPFTDGDDPRHLDAAASARIGSPQLRSFHEDREQNLMLIVDFRRPMLWGTRVRLRSIAAAEGVMLAGWRAALGGGAVGALVLGAAGVTIERPRPRHAGMARVAGHLARAHDEALAAPAGPVPPLAEGLRAALKHLPRGAGAVLASGLDDPGEGFDAALAALSARVSLTLLLIEDAFERAPPAMPLPMLTAEGPRWASFTGLDRAARTDRLRRPGLRVLRLDASAEGGAP